jgi:hypothetical protein
MVAAAGADPFPVLKFMTHTYKVGKKTFTSRTVQRAKFIVMANTYERLSLWRESHNEYKWDDNPVGAFVTIGSICFHPVAVQLTWSTINGQIVAFVEDSSQYVHHPTIEKWIMEELALPGCYKTDAMNFFNLLHAIDHENNKSLTSAP